jgi:hypothetical protein
VADLQIAFFVRVRPRSHGVKYQESGRESSERAQWTLRSAVGALPKVRRNILANALGPE